MTINTFEIAGNQFEIKISKDTDSLELTDKMFESLLIQEPVCVEGRPSNGLTLSLVELCFSTGEMKTISKFMSSRDKPVLIDIQLKQLPNIDTPETFKFKKTNMDLSISGDKICSVKMYGVTYLQDFTEINRVCAYSNKTAIATIQEVAKNSKIEIETTPDTIETTDEQNWIQGNLTDALFVSDLIKHSYIQDSFLLSAINYNKLRVIDINQAYKEAKNKKTELPFIGFPTSETDTLKDNDAIVPTKINIETLSGVWDYTLSDNTQNPIFNVVDGKMLDSSIKVDSSSFFVSLFKAKSIDTTTKSKITRTTAVRIDTGSTHDKYWEAYLSNQRGMYKLLQNMIYIETQMYLQKPIRPLDFVYLNLDTSPTEVSVYTGVAIILNQSRYFTKTGQHTQLLLANSFGNNETI